MGKSSEWYLAMHDWPDEGVQHRLDAEQEEQEFFKQLTTNINGKDSKNKEPEIQE